MSSPSESLSSRTRIMRTRSIFGSSTPVQAGAEVSASVVTVTTDSQPTANQYNNGGNSSLNKLSTIMPGFLIAFFCFAAVFLACGLIHTRRRRRQRMLNSLASVSTPPASEDSERPKKRKKTRPVKPVLWEVDMKRVHWEKDLEALHPVAVELQADPWPFYKAEGTEKTTEKRTHWFVPGLSKSHKPQDASPVQQAQVTFMVSMPEAGRRTNEPSREVALGTTVVPYRDEDSDDEDFSTDLVDRHGFTYAY